MSIAMGTRLHINLYIKLQVCRFWCFYHKMHNPTKKRSLAAVLNWEYAAPLYNIIVIFDTVVRQKRTFKHET